MSLVSEKVIEKINPKPKLSRRKVALQSVSGEALFVKGSTDLEFKVGNQTFVRRRNFILGTNWMSKNGVRIYFDLQKLRVGNLYVPYEQDIHIVSLLRVNKTTVLKPQTAQICQVRMKDVPYFEQGAMLEIVGTDKGFLSEEPGFWVTNSVVTQNKSRKYSVLLVNSTKKTLKVKRGCAVGRTESVQEAREFLVVAVAQGPTKGKSKFDLSEVDAPEDVKSRVVKLVNDNAHLFPSSDLDLGQTQTVECNVETGDHDPIKMRLYIEFLYKTGRS